MVGTVRTKLNPVLVRFVMAWTDDLSGVPESWPGSHQLLPVPAALSRRLDKEEVVTEIGRAYEAGATSTALAHELGLSRTGVLNLLRGTGVKVRTRRALTAAEVDTAERLYGEGWILREIGAELGVSQECVRRALLKRGVKLRVGLGARKR
jgi:DNA-binding transcriptional regulator LsrR (DeoR family)